MGKIDVGELFFMSDETDEVNEVEVLATMTVDGREYVAVSLSEDLHDSHDDIDVVFLKVEKDGEYAAIELDEEFEIGLTKYH
ncbi:DUF1292 domain-containing protein [Bacillus andreraoultii]|uniref:DUF1292 domain-containing protein n=1 Tax=Bacillus andreraoultii TaxID=1499685 RepID=UPI00053AF0A2|nr:DUF1292 domain-containing protein [Bacillus andreraoultii]